MVAWIKLSTFCDAGFRLFGGVDMQTAFCVARKTRLTNRPGWPTHHGGGGVDECKGIWLYDAVYDL